MYYLNEHNKKAYLFKATLRNMPGYVSGYE